MLKKTSTTQDLSAIVTGILLAYNLPANMPIWATLIGCFVAINVTKIAFGGLGKNIFNPALVGRVFLFLSFSKQMNTWVEPKLFDFMNVDVTTSATNLSIIKYEASANYDSVSCYWDMFLGNIGGSMGEVSALALIIGGIYMLYRKIITWHIPIVYLSSFFILVFIAWLYEPLISLDPLTHLLSGGLLLGAIFMATDYSTSPMSKKGKIIFAIGCGVLTFVIRIYSSYPEGVSFAILIMNAFVPLIDNYARPRVFGRRTK